MVSWKHASVSLAMILASWHCSESPRNSLAIYGGKPAGEGEWSSTVGLSRAGKLRCTGTVIHPRVVVTAAHCLNKKWAPEEIGIAVGNGTLGGAVEAQYRAESFGISPLFSRPSGASWNDAAYIVTSEPIEGVTIIPVLTDPQEIASVLRLGRSTVIAGYGQIEDLSFGVKYVARAPISSMRDNEVIIGGQGQDACRGDSGGPAFAQLDDGSWRAFGILSRSSGVDCDFESKYGRMDSHVCWIQRASGIDLGVACP